MKKYIIEKDKYIKLLLIFFILNIMDIALTIWQVELIGIEIEANPLMSYFIQDHGYFWTMVFKIVIGFLICIYLYYRYDENKVKNDNKQYMMMLILVLICLIFYSILNIIHVLNITVYYGSYIYYS